MYRGLRALNWYAAAVLLHGVAVVVGSDRLLAGAVTVWYTVEKTDEISVTVIVWVVELTLTTAP